jgi:2-polyprenyl-3-methyl-5-hydroxy-6-metoxy-1,4-benzoquinol methylase
MDDDATRWDERYRSVTTVEPQPPEPLADFPDLLEFVPVAGVAIDIACGPGSQTLWLAERGLEVTAFDVSPVAIALVDDAARVRRLSHRIEARVIDLDDGLPSHPTFAEVIVCQRFRHPSLYADIIDRLAPRGVAFVTVLSQVGAESPGPFHAPADELVEAFTRDDLELLHLLEAGGVATVMARRA